MLPTTFAITTDTTTSNHPQLAGLGNDGTVAGSCAWPTMMIMMIMMMLLLLLLLQKMHD